jgi:hypothetical protein
VDVVASLVADAAIMPATAAAAMIARNVPGSMSTMASRVTGV